MIRPYLYNYYELTKSFTTDNNFSLASATQSFGPLILTIFPSSDLGKDIDTPPNSLEILVICSPLLDKKNLWCFWSISHSSSA